MKSSPIQFEIKGYSLSNARTESPNALTATNNLRSPKKTDQNDNLSHFNSNGK